MTDMNDRVVTDGEDLRAIYASESRERVPPHLDKIVMLGAKNELQEGIVFGGFLRWRRSAAFAITLTLTFALFLQWNELPLVERSPVTVRDQERGFASEAESSSTRMREIGQTATHRFLGQDEAANSVTDTDDGGANAVSGDRPIAVCRDDQIGSPESWLECIAILRGDGFAEVADEELVKFSLAHPDFQITP